MAKHVDGVVYKTQASPNNSCHGCAGYAHKNLDLCVRLADQIGREQCPGYIWVLDDTKAIDQKRIEECAAAMTVELALAVQQAGGSVDILKSMTVLEFVSTCARNNIELKARWMK